MPRRRSSLVECSTTYLGNRAMIPTVPVINSAQACWVRTERLLWGASDDWCGRLRGSRKGNECSVIICENNEIYSIV